MIVSIFIISTIMKKIRTVFLQCQNNVVIFIIFLLMFCVVMFMHNLLKNQHNSTSTSVILYRPFLTSVENL